MAAVPAFQQVDRLHREIHEHADMAHQTPGPVAEAEVGELHRLSEALLDELNLLLRDAVL
jgi:hypothetical protein